MGDLIVYSSTWSEHLDAIRMLFEGLMKHKLTINLVKSEFVKATVQYLGHVVGQGHILPLTAKVQAILAIVPPTNRKALTRIIGMIAYYRKFCPNPSSILTPLTGLVSPKVKFVWDSRCQEALEKVLRNAY